MPRSARKYGIPHALWREYTVDHLVPIELGGEPFATLDGDWNASAVTTWTDRCPHVAEASRPPRLGIKAPRRWGWLTSPKRAAYNASIIARRSIQLSRFCGFIAV